MQKDCLTTDIVIVGCGPAGMMAISHAGMLGLKTISVDSMPNVGGQCSALYKEKKIYDIPALLAITANQLISNLEAQYQDFKPHIILNTKVLSIQNSGNKKIVHLSDGNQISCHAVVIASGKGHFQPNKPEIENLSNFENKSVFYSVTEKSLFRNKIVTIAGGGDSAADWTIELSSVARKIILVHRRDGLRCAPHSQKEIADLVSSGKVEMRTSSVIESINGNDGIVNSATLLHLKDGNHLEIKTDYVLLFFGLVSDNSLLDACKIKALNGHAIVKSATMESSRRNIFAIGDVAKYNGKLPLILTGFAEGAIAMREIFKRLYPEKSSHFAHSTEIFKDKK